uniref:Uncharacterized protein n=1 Tax=Parascaris univalens TaxID=6257 RepID=A0A915BD73_PARUN
MHKESKLVFHKNTREVLCKHVTSYLTIRDQELTAVIVRMTKNDAAKFFFQCKLCRTGRTCAKRKCLLTKRSEVNSNQRRSNAISITIHEQPKAVNNNNSHKRNQITAHRT